MLHLGRLSSGGVMHRVISLWLYGMVWDSLEIDWKVNRLQLHDAAK